MDPAEPQEDLRQFLHAFGEVLRADSGLLQHWIENNQSLNLDHLEDPEQAEQIHESRVFGMYEELGLYLEELAGLRAKQKTKNDVQSAKLLRDKADDALFDFAAAWVVEVPQHREVLPRTLELIGRYIHSMASKKLIPKTSEKFVELWYRKALEMKEEYVPPQSGSDSEQKLRAADFRLKLANVVYQTVDYRLKYLLITERNQKENLAVLKNNINDLLTIPLQGIKDDERLLEECVLRKNDLILRSIDLYDKIKSTFHSIKKYDRMEDPGKAKKPQPAEDGIDALKSKWLRSLSDDDPHKKQLQEAYALQRKPDSSKSFNLYDYKSQKRLEATKESDAYFKHMGWVRSTYEDYLPNGHRNQQQSERKQRRTGPN